MYITLEAANEYFATRLHADAWDDIDSDSENDKIKALTTASNALDRLNYVSQKADDDQDHEFPRGGDTTIPVELQIACCEEALSLLEGRDPIMEEEQLRLYTQTYANVKAGYDPKMASEHIINGFTSPIAWRYIKPFLRNRMSPEVVRV